MRSWLYRPAGYLVVSPAISFLFEIDAVGKEHLPERGPFLLATNHISHFDPLILCVACWKQKPRLPLRFLAKEELFTKFPVGPFMRNIGQIPVARGSASASDSLKYAREALAQGEAIGIFPEGTVSLTFVPMKGHTGVARLAVESAVPVVPAGIWGTHRSMAKYRGRELKAHRPVTLDIGPPRTFTAADGSPTEIAAAMMADIAGLVDQARSRYPDKAQPSDWWGPPDWPIERAGKWRPRLDKSMTGPEALAEADRAMRA